jgi:hypothetical protein
MSEYEGKWREQLDSGPLIPLTEIEKAQREVRLAEEKLTAAVRKEANKGKIAEVERAIEQITHASTVRTHPALLGWGFLSEDEEDDLRDVLIFFLEEVRDS